MSHDDADRPAGDASTGTSDATDTESDGQRRLSRRGLLRSAAGAGYGLGVAALLGVDEFLAASDETVTIETALVRPDPTDHNTLERRTKEVPGRWYSAVSRAIELHDRISDVSVPGYVGSAVVPGPHESGSARITLGVDADEFTSLPGDIAELIPQLDVDWENPLDGISIDVDHVGGVDELEADAPEPAEPRRVSGADVDPVPGGVRCETPESSATLTPAIYHPDLDGPAFATAWHAYIDVDQAVGEPLYLPTADNDRPRIGEVVDAFRPADVAVARPIDGYRPGSVLDGASVDGVAGQYTTWGLADLVARNVELESVGGTSSRSRGEIQAIHALSCVRPDRCRYDQVRWGSERNMSDGDSGSVCYNPEPEIADGALVVSVNVARTWWPGQDHVWGIAADELTRRHGYHF